MFIIKSHTGSSRFARRATFRSQPRLTVGRAVVIFLTVAACEGSGGKFVSVSWNELPPECVEKLRLCSNSVPATGRAGASPEERSMSVAGKSQMERECSQKALDCRAEWELAHDAAWPRGQYEIP